MAEFNYNVEHHVSDTELRTIEDILAQMGNEDICTVVIDRPDGRNVDRVIGVIDEEKYQFYTKGSEVNDTHIIVKRK